MNDAQPRGSSSCSRKSMLGAFYLNEGFSSLFTYCTQVLHLSEHAAYNRIETARAARRFPVVFGLVLDGSVTLTAVRLLAPHLTPENHRGVLGRARHRSKRPMCRPSSASCQLQSSRRHRKQEIDVARAPVVDAHQAMDEAPQPVAGMTESPAVPAGVTQKRAAEVRPLAPERYKIQFTVGRETHDGLRRAQDLLRHTIPNSDPAAILDRALALLVADLERRKIGATDRPRTSRAAKVSSRHIPSQPVVKRQSGTSSFVAARTIITKPGATSAQRCRCCESIGPSMA